MRLGKFYACTRLFMHARPGALQEETINGIMGVALTRGNKNKKILIIR